MKTKLALSIAAAAALAMASCADLGFGVDVGNSGPSPYFYGSSGPFYSGYSGYPYFGVDFPYGYWGDYIPSAPPIIGNGPGSISPGPRPDHRPHLPNINGSNPGPVIFPSGANIPGAGAGTRPGNGGLPSGKPVVNNPPSVPAGQPTRGR